MDTAARPGTLLMRFASDAEAFGAQQIIFTEGDPGECMYVVKQGEVNVLVRNIIVETIGEGGILGEMALIDKAPRSASAIAKTDCQLVRITEERFKFLVQQTPYFALEVMRVMAGRLRNMD